MLLLPIKLIYRYYFKLIPGINKMNRRSILHWSSIEKITTDL